MGGFDRIQDDNELLLHDWADAFEIYFKFKNYKWKIAQDGGGVHFHTRPWKLNKKAILTKLYDETLTKEDAVELINCATCLKFNPFSDLEVDNYWDPRCSDQFLADVKQYKDDPRMLKVICFYMIMAARGVLMIHDYSKLYW